MRTFQALTKTVALTQLETSSSKGPMPRKVNLEAAARKRLASLERKEQEIQTEIAQLKAVLKALEVDNKHLKRTKRG